MFMYLTTGLHCFSVAVTEIFGLYLLVLLFLLFLFMVQDQLQQKIVCPGVVTCLNASPDGLFLAAAVAEAIHLWEVSQFCASQTGQQIAQ